MQVTIHEDVALALQRPRPRPQRRRLSLPDTLLTAVQQDVAKSVHYQASERTMSESPTSLATESRDAGVASGASQASGSNSSFGPDTSDKGGIWARFTRRRSEDAAVFQVVEEPYSCTAASTESCRAFLRELRRKALLATRHPDIWLTGLLVLSPTPTPSTPNP